MTYQHYTIERILIQIIHFPYVTPLLQSSLHHQPIVKNTTIYLNINGN
jgi:hypothetical protein